MSKSRLLVVAAIVAIGAYLSTATLLGWTQDGIEWQAYPVGSSAGDCFGNCGAGCSDTWNICGGPTQYWDLTYVAGPDAYQTGTDYECWDNVYYARDWTEYHAIGTWTYHGWVAPLCITHDVTCDWWVLGCLWAAPCGEPRWEDTWSYNEWMRGYQYGSWQYTGWAC